MSALPLPRSPGADAGKRGEGSLGSPECRPSRPAGSGVSGSSPRLSSGPSLSWTSSQHLQHDRSVESDPLSPTHGYSTLHPGIGVKLGPHPRHELACFHSPLHHMATKSSDSSLPLLFDDFSPTTLDHPPALATPCLLAVGLWAALPPCSAHQELVCLS